MKKTVLSAYLGLRAALMLPFARVRPGFDPSRVRSVLVIRNDRVGDMVLTTPLLRAIGESMPEAELTVLASASNADVLTGNPDVARVVVQSGGLIKTAGELRQSRFDLAIDPVLTYGLGTAILCLLSGAKYRAGFAWAGREALFNLPCPPAEGGGHIVARHLDIARALGLAFIPSAPGIYISASEREAALDVMRGAGVDPGSGGPLVAIHPGGYYPSQRWPARRFGELAQGLADRYGARPVFFSGRAESGLVEEASAAMRDRPARLAGLGMREFLAALSLCRMFAGNNSGPLHCAAALGLPTLSFMGPTDTELFAPYGPGHAVLRKRLLPCLGCGKGYCERMTCMEGITVAEALDAAGKVLEALP
ncbi:MAG: glycosyltransferase family 9 protein [Nitrospirae bacterium]|nr:glycosyltransferase family 9 protein [Nitrospirota bacterium]